MSWSHEVVLAMAKAFETEMKKMRLKLRKYGPSSSDLFYKNSSLGFLIPRIINLCFDDDGSNS